MNSEIDSNHLRHSNEGISISSRFYNKKVMVYVEGPDDVSFWDAMFHRVISEDFYEIEAVNGKNNLYDYIEGIENGSIKNAFVATDLDYSLFPKDNRSLSAFVIYTYGHSIENTMFCPLSVAAYIRKALHTTHDFNIQVIDWFKVICKRIQALLPYDIINSTDAECKYHISNGHNSFLGKKFYFYQDKSDLINLDQSIVEKEAASHPDFDIEEVKRLHDYLLSLSTRETRHIIQGHFLADAAMNFIRLTIKNMGKTIALSDDALYLAFFDCYAHCPALCHDKEHVCAYIKRAVEAYNKQSVSS